MAQQKHSKNILSRMGIPFMLMIVTLLVGCNSSFLKNPASSVQNNIPSSSQSTPAFPKISLAALPPSCPLNVLYLDEKNNVILNGQNIRLRLSSNG